MNSVDISLNLEASYYVDDAVFARERERLFATSWQYLGAASALDERGSYICRSIAGTSVIVLRGRDGELRGFLNSCRHRGAPLLDEGSGRCPRQLQCPYHLWRYDDHGRLVDAPWFGDSPDFNMADWPLNPIQVEIWRGLLFVAIRPGSDLAEQLGDTVAEIADVPIEDYSHGGDALLTFDANWKIYTDNFVEGYHIPGIHPGFFAQIDFENFVTEARDGIVCMSAPTGDDIFYEGRWYWMWPNWTLSLYPSGMSTSRINPTAAGHTELHYSFFFEDMSDTAAADREETIERNLNVIREDFGICLGIHKNYQSGGYTPGPLSTRHEKGVAWFQQRLRDTID